MRHSYVEAVCEYCGADFNARKDLVQINRGRFCSRSCSARSRAPKTLLVYADTSSGPDACWPWTGYREPHGYGRINRLGERVLAHRAVYEELVGPIPDGADILHDCDNVACVNPAHLRPGSHAENMNDMVKRGRSQNKKGSEVHSAVIDEVVAAQVKALLRAGYSAPGVANALGISKHITADIQRGKTWRHVADGVAQPFGAGAKEAA